MEEVPSVQKTNHSFFDGQVVFSEKPTTKLESNCIENQAGGCSYLAGGQWTWPEQQMVHQPYGCESWYSHQPNRRAH